MSIAGHGHTPPDKKSKPPHDSTRLGFAHLLGAPRSTESPFLGLGVDEEKKALRKLTELYEELHESDQDHRKAQDELIAKQDQLIEQLESDNANHRQELETCRLSNHQLVNQLAERDQLIAKQKAVLLALAHEQEWEYPTE